MKKFKVSVLALEAIMATIAFTACNQASPEVKGEGEKILIGHELGETEVNKNPERVIVFDYGIIESMETLGEDIIGLAKSSLPPKLSHYDDEKYIDVGTLHEPNFEVIYESNPDLIIISGRQRDSYDELSKIAPTVFVSIDGADYLNSFKGNMEILGQIFNQEEIIAEKVGEIEEKMEVINEKGSKIQEKALFLMANDGNLSIYGRGSRFGILHNEFGLSPVDENIEASNLGQKITFEYLVEKDPDYLFVMDRGLIAGADVSAHQVMDNELVKMTSAYKNGNIIYLDAYTWYVSTGGIEGTLRMIDEVSSAIK